MIRDGQTHERRTLRGAMVLSLAIAGVLATPAQGAAVPTWTAAAVRLTAPVYRPTVLPAGSHRVSLTTQRLGPAICGRRTVEQVDAHYRAAGGLRLRFFEGSPFICANLGAPPVIARTRIGRSRATIYAITDSRTAIFWNTDWRATNPPVNGVGTDIFIEINRRDTDLLVRLARGMRIVPL
jgi:hypothetical protein